MLHRLHVSMFKYFLSPVCLSSDCVTELTIRSCIFCFQKPNTTIRLFDKTVSIGYKNAFVLYQFNLIQSSFHVCLQQLRYISSKIWSLIIKLFSFLIL